MTEIEQRIRELLSDDEIAELEDRNGWAIGTVAMMNVDGEIEQELDNAVIELFNGDGGAGEFGGVRFTWVDPEVDYEEAWEDQGYQEAYAHASKEALERNGTLPSWFVKEFTDPEKPYVGQESP